MMRCRIGRLAMLGAILCLFVPQPAHAQIGGFIKKKVKQAVKGQVTGGDTAAATRAAPSGPTFDEWVLELTPANLDRFEQGLTAERAFRDSIDAVYAKLPSPEAYQTCQIRVATSPEALKLVQNIDPSNVQAAMQANQKRLDLAEKRCGPDPARRSKSDDLRGAEARGAAAAGLKPSQYGIIKERVKPFCGPGGGTAKVAGAMSGMYYVYSETEMSALQPRCQKLVALIDAKPRVARPRP